MNKIESYVYKKVKNNYLLKNSLRNIYQGFFDLLPNYDSKFSSSLLVREGYYFGFHDLDPFSRDSQKVLCNRLLIPLRMPTPQDALEIGYLDGKDFSDWHCLAKTHAWNYHKGCRLQWTKDERIVYNDSENGQLCAKVIDMKGNMIQKLNYPIDTVSYDGKLATNFSYGRLEQNMPGYGYCVSDADAVLSEGITEKTGLYLIDMERNTRKMLLSIQQISEFEHEPSMDDKMHFVTHTEFSYDNRYVAFLHRWYKGVSRHTRLMVYDLQEHQLMASPTTGMVSHYVWNHLNGIVAYCRVEDVDSHVYFSSPEMKEWKRCAYPVLNSDGHQHFIDDDWFLVDTYPDKWRHVRLYKVNRVTDEIVLLADAKSPKCFVSPSEHKHWKCDLHPRCSADGKWICFDSVHTGKRSLCIMPSL